VNRRPTLCFDAKLYVWLALLASPACHESDLSRSPTDAAINPVSSDASLAAPPVSEASDAGAIDAGGRDASVLLDAELPAQGNARPPPDARDSDTAAQPPSADGGSACAPCQAHESCDVAARRCVDDYQPFALDCASLPSNGACQGGPREVLLAINKYGRILMFDPSDGHFLGHFKDETAELGDFGSSGYRMATQGPDQCIWSLFDDSRTSGSEAEQQRAIERWNGDGTFRDHFIPRGKHYREGSADRLADAVTLAFSAEHVYVAADERVTRFTTSGAYVDERLQYAPAALSVGRDGSLLVAKSGVTLVQGTVERNLLSEVRASQLWYTGKGMLLVAGGSQESFALDVASRMASAWQPSDSDVVGVAALRNGRYLITGDDVQVATLDPAAVPRGTIQSVVSELGASFGSMRQIGRACLSETFVAARAPKPPVPEDACAAPAGPALLEEHFDGGTFVDGLYRGFRILDVPMTSVSIADGSLRIEGGDQHSDTVEHTFADLRPSYVGYRMKVEDPFNWGAYFRLQDGGLQSELALVYASFGELGAGGSELGHEIAPDSWVQVQLRDIDWQRRTFDLYFDCKRVADDIAMQGEQLSRLVLYNFDAAAVSHFDDLVIK